MSSLDDVSRLRARADQARRLALGVSDPTTLAALKQFAVECDAQAASIVAKIDVGVDDPRITDASRSDASLPDAGPLPDAGLEPNEARDE